MRCLAPLVLVPLVSACSSPAPDPCGGTGDVLSGYTLTADGITVDITTAPYRVVVRDGDGREVLASSQGADGYAGAAWATGWATIDNNTAPGWYTFQSGLDPWHSDLEATVARVGDGTVELGLRDPDDAGAACATVTHTVRASALRVEAHLADGADAPRAWSAGFSTPADERFLGFGERFNRTDHRGRDVFSWAEEGGLGTGEGQPASAGNPYPSGEEMTYYPVPFFVSTRGYGFWLDSTWRSQFDLATGRADAWRAWHVGPTLAYEVYTPTPGDARPWPYQVIDRFTAATGRPMVPPPWAYGPRRRFGPSSMQNGVPEDQAMRDLDLAITAVDDAVHFYPNGSHLGRESQLAAWTARAAALGYRVNGYYNSMISRQSDSPLAARAAEGVANGYFLVDAAGQPPDVFVLTGGNLVPLYVVDFTSSAATTWYQSSFDWANDLGYSGWMYDFGEYVQPEVVASDGTSGDQLHNLYPTLYARAAHDYLEAGPRAGDWMAFMRSGFTGSSAYVPLVWAGDPAASFEDSDGLPSMVRAGINLGISGVPNFGGDIGGYHCQADGAQAADGELWTRWIQQGALTPNMQDQNACVGSSASLKASIWTSPDAQDAWRTYARLHTRLFPYLYTLGVEANRTGAPIIRQVFLEHPDRPDLAVVDDAYYFGSALYVAPVVARGARQKTVTLPAGLYLDWQAETLITGGATVTLDAPLAKLPLLLRAGYLVPMLDPTIDTLAEEASAAIVSAADVADVYDVVGLLEPTSAGAASFTLHDGGTLSATWSGSFAAPALPMAADVDELSTCSACWLVTPIATGLDRVRISAPAGTVTAGGLTLTSATGRRIRWDLYLVSGT